MFLFLTGCFRNKKEHLEEVEVHLLQQHLLTLLIQKEKKKDYSENMLEDPVRHRVIDHDRHHTANEERDQEVVIEE